MAKKAASPVHKIVVPGRAPTLNEWRQEHYRTQAKNKAEWQEAIYWALKEAGVPGVLKTPIQVKATVFTVQERDHDNCWPSIKYVHDALVANKYIFNDKPKYVLPAFCQWAKAESLKDERVEYEIFEGTGK